MNYQFKVLNLLIADKDNYVKSLETNNKEMESKILQFNDQYVNRFIGLQKQFKLNQIRQYKKINIKKFNKLQQKTFDHFNFHTRVNNNWLINLTDIDIPEDVAWLLSLGAKFSLPIEQGSFPLLKIIADVENVLTKETNDDEREIKRSKVSHILNKRKFTNTIRNPVDVEIIRIYKKTKRFCDQHKELFITVADKGNRTIIMLKPDYESKMSDLLNDQTTYKQLQFDTTDALHARLHYIATTFLKKGWINEEIFKNITMYNSAVPKIYGQPKIHKRGTPLRPVVASYESPNYKVSKFMAEILKNLTKSSKYNVKNASHFVNEVRSTRLDTEDRCVSFDVTSLFTNVPLDLLEQILSDRWDEICVHTDIPKNEFFQLLNFIIRDCNQFSYKDTMYKQLEGVPMGLPLSPILADIVMEYILDKAMDSLNFELKSCAKYVDDLFLIIPKHRIQETLNIFNSIHPKIQFTHEIERNKTLPFLDVSVIHDTNGSLQFDWYTKPTSSGRILNYFSNHPLTQKLNVVDNLVKRIFNISSPQFHAKNRKIVKNILLNNNYPPKVIEQRIKKYFCSKNLRMNNNNNNIHTAHPIHNNNNNTTTTQQNSNINTSTQTNINTSSTTNLSQHQTEIQYRGMLFDPSCTQNISKLICKGIPDLKMGYKPYMTNRSVFSKPKQKTPKERMYNVVYSIPCFGDGRRALCDLEYVGTTGHRVGNRFDQHDNDMTTFNLTNDLENTTAIVHHFYDTGHVPDREKATILAVEHTYTKRKVLEALHILTQPNTMNFRRDTENISAAYKSLLS